MKRLIFHDMFAISERERSARRIQFDRRMTVIKGPNDTGKSSLIKSIYRTFGAEPAVIHPKWRDINVSTSVRFSLDGELYRLLRERNSFTVFDSDDRYIQEFSSVTRGLAPYFASLFNFRLSLAPRRGAEGERQATPAFLFLPFYFDQDASWTKNWSGFTSLQQFSRWRQDVVQFHTGIRPAEYYHAKAKKTEAQQHLAEVQHERAVVSAIRKRLERDLPVGTFDLDIDAFRAEVDEIVGEATQLKRVEDQIREDLVALNNEKNNLLLQKRIAEAAISELREDFEWAAEHGGSVACPTCGTDHENNFIEKFRIASDEGSLNELLADVNEALLDVQSRIDAVQEKMNSARDEVARIQEILGQRKNELEFADLIRAEGKRELRTIVSVDIDTLNKRAGDIDERIEEADTEMRRLGSRERRMQIRDRFRAQFEENARLLNVHGLPSATFSRLDAAIRESGSDLPRALLAYYFAVLETANQHSTSTFCPIVIDSPKQQDQDDANWSAMLQFIRDRQPAGSQIVLGTVDAEEDLPGSEVELETKYHVLEQASYAEVADDFLRLREERERGREIS